MIAPQTLTQKVTLPVLELKLWKSISRLPDIAQICFRIRNEAMDISFQNNIVLALLDEYCQSNRAKTQSHFYWDTL